MPLSNRHQSSKPDQRRTPRMLPGRQPVGIRLRHCGEQRVFVAYLLDESLNGLAVRLRNIFTILPGETIEITFEHEWHKAHVRRIERFGRYFHMGLEWTDLTVELVADFPS